MLRNLLNSLKPQFNIFFKLPKFNFFYYRLYVRITGGKLKFHSNLELML